MKSSIGGLQNVLGPLTGALGIREIIKYADAWTEAGNKVAAAAQVSGQIALPLEQIKESANGARTSLVDYVDLYARLLRISPAVGASAIDVATATNVVAKSLKAGGASAQEQTAALIQLGQALGSGQLQGDELRSIRENAPLVAKAIANEFGVSIGELKKLGAEGKLTSERVFQALINAQDDIEAAFRTTQSTIGDAFQRIENEFTSYIGTSGQATGATQALVDALGYVADHFKEIAPVVATFAAILGGALAGVAIAGVVVGLGQALLALGAFLAAVSAGTLTAGLFTAALGPIGLLAGAAAAAILILNYNQYDAAKAAKAHSIALTENQEKMDLARDSSDGFRKALQQQIALQLSAAEAALVEADAQLEAAQTKAMAAAIFDIAMQGIGQTLGMIPSGPAGPSPFDKEILGPAEQRVADAKKNIADVRRQLAEIDALRLTPAGTADTQSTVSPAGGKSGADSPYQNALDGIAKRTAALQAETAAQATLNPLVEDYGYAMERAKVASDLLQAAKDAEIAITPDVEAAINAAAEAYAHATVEAKKLAEAQNIALESMRGWSDLGRDALSGFITDLKNGKSAAEALGGVFDKLADKFLDMGLDAIFGTGGKDFGIVGKLFGFKDGGVAANGRPQALPKFASGGVANSASIFGEAGPEAAVPLPDGRRIPVDLRMPSSGGSGGALTVSVSVGVQNGELVPLIAQISGEVAGRQIDQRTPAIVHSVAPGAVAKANRNRTR
jgi:tape measure domain-containing protein